MQQSLFAERYAAPEESHLYHLHKEKLSNSADEMSAAVLGGKLPWLVLPPPFSAVMSNASGRKQCPRIRPFTMLNYSVWYYYIRRLEQFYIDLRLCFTPLR